MHVIELGMLQKRIFSAWKSGVISAMGECYHSIFYESQQWQRRGLFKGILLDVGNES